MKSITEFSGSAMLRARQAMTRFMAEGVEGADTGVLLERLSTELGISGDRLARLLEAVGVVGENVEQVRLVRVFAAEHEPKGAKKVGEFNYLIDYVPDPRAAAKDDRRRGDRPGGRGGGGGGRGGGGGGGIGGAPGAHGKSGTGGYSMGRDGLAKEERGGPGAPSQGAGWVLTRDASGGHDRGRGRGGPGGGRGGPPGGRGGPPGGRGGPAGGRGGPAGGRGGPGGGPGGPPGGAR